MADRIYELDRDTYRAIKKMSREQMTNLCKNVYNDGYNAGYKEGSQIAMDLTAIKEALLDIKGIGAARVDAIMKVIEENTEKVDSDSESNTE